MICDNCGKREAIIAYTKMQGNSIEEVHLCAQCAEEKMKKDLAFNNAVSGKMENFLKDLFKLTGKFNNNIPNKKCSHCGTTFEDLGKNQVGCEYCYDEFKEEIESMLLNFKSSSKHKGKIPKSAGKEPVYKREENELRDKLSVAVELEEYEEAAVLRDKLKQLRDEKWV